MFTGLELVVGGQTAVRMLLPCPPCIALECAQRSPCLACAGLDEAILGNLGNGGSDSGGGGGGNPEEDSRKIADLLKHGAHCLHAMEAANEQVGAGWEISS